MTVSFSLRYSYPQTRKGSDATHGGFRVVGLFVRVVLCLSAGARVWGLARPGCFDLRQGDRGMPSLLLRCCATCRFHREGVTGTTGTCKHPDRQPIVGLTPFVRDLELPCRMGWGSDLWEPRDPDEQLPFVVGLRVWGPFPDDDTPLDNLPGDLLSFLLRSADAL